MKTKKYENRSMIFAASFSLYFCISYLSYILFASWNITAVSLSYVLPPVLGIVYGWHAIIGCTVGNLMWNFIYGYTGPAILLGIFAQILFGALPYYVWKKVVKGTTQLTRLNTPTKVLAFVTVTAADCALFGLCSAGINGTGAALRTAVGTFDVCTALGLPLMVAFNIVYSKWLHERKRKITVNEIIILCAGVVDFVGFMCIIVTAHNLRGRSTAETVRWIFTAATYMVSITTAVSLGTMLVFNYIYKKKSGLRIFEKKSGLIFADEKKNLEFVTFPGFEPSHRIKADSLGYKYEDTLTIAAPTYENAWYTVLSCQKGCQMKCAYCDCSGYGYHGNAAVEDLKYQTEVVLNNAGSRHTKLFQIEFKRMGEPLFNPAVLEYIELYLQQQVRDKTDADVICPVISTMMPKRAENVLDYLLHFCRIKNENYGGNAVLQISIESTDENIRKKLFHGNSMSLEEISDICKQLPVPVGEKYILSFAVTKDSVIDAGLIDSLFDREKFLVGFTPIHKTFAAGDNGFKVTREYTDFSVFEQLEKPFLDLGWEVYTFLDKADEDDDGLTCGNLMLANVGEKSLLRKRDKKRIGLILAIEIDAIFKLYPDYRQLSAPAGYKAYLIEKDNFMLFVLQAGMGEVAASAGVQYLVSEYNVSMILNFGVVGGLTADMSKQKVCIVDRVVHYKYDCSEFLNLAIGQVDFHDSIYIKTSEALVKKALAADSSLKTVTCCSGDKFISTAEEKTYLHQTFGGDICDMESAGIVLTSEANRVPCILFKAVSDGLADGADGFFAELESASLNCLKTADMIMEQISKTEE